MTEDKEVDHTDRFGFHPGEAVVKLVPGAKELPKLEAEAKPKDDKPKGQKS